MNDEETRNHEYEVTLVRHATLAIRGDNVDDEDDLLERLSELEGRLSAKAIRFFQGLSSDLYMLEDDEIAAKTIKDFEQPRTLAEAIQREYKAENWQGVLALLRQESRFLPQEVRAYLRGRAYEELGHHAAAWAFYLNASARNEDGDSLAYDYFGLLSLSKWDLEASYQESDRIMNDPRANPALKLLAAYLIVNYFRGNIEQKRQEIRDLAGKLLPAIGATVNDGRIPDDVVGTGYAALGLILEVLHDYSNAVDVLRIVGRYIPPDAEMVKFIGLLEEAARSGRGVNSGILLNPEPQIWTPAHQVRENNYHTAMNRKVERSLVID